MDLDSDEKGEEGWNCQREAMELKAPGFGAGLCTPPGSAATTHVEVQEASLNSGFSSVKE